VSAPSAPTDKAVEPLKAKEFAKIRRLAYETFGLDLRAGKEALVSARLGRQMREWGCTSFDQYYRLVVEDTTGETLIQLIDALATNHTSFLREPSHFEFLRKTLVPAWRGRKDVKIWSAACSTGEEPYSIAMCLLEELGTEATNRVRILATDISTKALATAGKGIYPAERFQDLPEHQLRRFWLRGEGEWEGWYGAKRELRALVEFRRLNLLESRVGVGLFAVIFCRNVMIYFDRPTQQTVVQQLSECLEPGGYLLVGHAEGLSGVRHVLEYVRPAVYRKPQRRERG